MNGFGVLGDGVENWSMLVTRDRVLSIDIHVLDVEGTEGRALLTPCFGRCVRGKWLGRWLLPRPCLPQQERQP
jgi:hypothetical protein